MVNVTPEAGQSAEFALENTTKIYTPLLTGHLVRTTEHASTSMSSASARRSTRIFPIRTPWAENDLLPALREL